MIKKEVDKDPVEDDSKIENIRFDKEPSTKIKNFDIEHPEIKTKSLIK